MSDIKLNLPLKKDQIKELKAGDSVLLTGYLYTGRDVAHKRLCELIKLGKKLPFELKNQTLYYVGPAPAKPGYIIGPAGPTTSCRMDDYTIPLLEKGLTGMIGKGFRTKEVIEAIKKYEAIYFAAVGGAAALISKTIKYKKLVCYEDLETEAVYKLYVDNFPVIVAIDSSGKSLY